MRETTKTIFEAIDGAIFESEADCKAHEADLAKEKGRVSYWLVWHGADCTEGRGMFQCTFVKFRYGAGYSHHSHEALMTDWCFDKFGKRTAFVQGVQPTDNWTLFTTTEQAYTDHKPGRHKHFFHYKKEVEFAINRPNGSSYTYDYTEREIS